MAVNHSGSGPTSSACFSASVRVMSTSVGTNIRCAPITRANRVATLIFHFLSIGYPSLPAPDSADP